jgi:di/tricarboxylate transporter
MPDWYSHYIYLILGVIFFSGAVVSTCTGKTSARTGRIIYRAKEPNVFLWVVAMYYLAALLFVGLYLYEGP